MYGKPWKTQILRKFRFLMAVMLLGYPKYILGKFGIFLKKFSFFFTFSWTFGHSRPSRSHKNAQKAAEMAYFGGQNSLNFSKSQFAVFYGFKISHFSSFWIFLWLWEGLECPKSYKNVKNLKIFQKYSKLCPITFWDHWTHHKTPRIAIFGNFMNFDFQNKQFY